jgi:HPt (histidine-containing phosphotransfer) domain-containing protein
VTEPIDRTAWANLVEMTGGDLDFIDELVDTYIQDGEGQVAALRSAADAGIVDDLVRPAHSLKSSSLNLGALGLGDQARELEEAARTGAVPDAVQRVAAINTEFEEVRSALLADRAGRSSG